MKRIISLLALLFLFFSANAQDFKGILDAKPDTIIKHQNYFTSDSRFWQEFISAKQLSTGYMCLVYKSHVDTFKNGMLEMYYFDKSNKCVALKTVFELKDMPDQLKTLNDLGYKQIGKNTLYYSKSNVKAIYHVQVEENVAVVIYMRKETPDIF